MRNRQTAALDSCFQNLYFPMDFKIGCQGTQSCDLRGPDRRKINRYMVGWRPKVMFAASRAEMLGRRPRERGCHPDDGVGRGGQQTTSLS